MTLELNNEQQIEGRSTEWAHIFAGLGAAGVAIQNYQAVELFLLNILNGAGSASTAINWSTQLFSLTTGGFCSGMVNYWMNVELLNDFFNRMKKDEDYQYKKLSFWQQIQYFGGIFVFMVTGLLFGLMAFTFAEEGPLALLSIAVGLFVSGIMTIQEVETWLGSYDQKQTENNSNLTASQLIGKWTGHIIALGNVIALSLLFTLSLSQSLMFIGVAATPALITGFATAFSFGAFTEFYFYNYYLADFCKNISENINKMASASNFWLGVLSITTNAFVNAALTFSGIKILASLLLTSSLVSPPIALITIITTLSSFFAGSASLVLGMDFWIKQNESNKESEPAVQKKSSFSNNIFSLFSSKTEAINKTTPLAEAEIIPVPLGNTRF